MELNEMFYLNCLKWLSLYKESNPRKIVIKKNSARLRSIYKVTKNLLKNQISYFLNTAIEIVFTLGNKPKVFYKNILCRFSVLLFLFVKYLISVDTLLYFLGNI